MKALERSPARYPINRVDCKVFSVPRGNLSVNQENLYIGQLPKRIIIGMVDSGGFNGEYAKNPFLFGHYNTSFLCLYVNEKQVPTPVYTLNFERHDYLRAYHGLFAATGQLGRDEGNNISRTDYSRGYTLFAFDLSPELNDGDHFDLIKKGNIRLEMRFSVPLPSTVNVIVYAEFDNIVHIDKSRNVLFDYSL
ncbi:uncharacterized protein F54H12.2-like [Liolophura sinensis]|uniref:uncharacterized protein F54H12.2-like n=1 Tax=Liolophura sinensis TaxID=3198878 RepID=UPI003158D547